MITKLTTAQLKLMDKIRDKWIYTALLSGSKINKAEVKKGIYWLYEISKLKKPIVIFLDNPWHLQVGANYIKNPKQVYSQVYSQVRSQVDSQVDSQVYSQVRSQVYSQVHSQVDSQVRSQKLEYFYWGYEQLSYYSGWVAYLDFYNRILEFPKELKSDVQKYINYMKSGQFFCIFLDGFAFVCPRPSKVDRDGQNRLHSITGPAIYWKGYELYYINGVHFEKELWEKVAGDKLSAKEVFDLENTEQRRIAYEQMDKKKMLELDNYKVLDSRNKDEQGNPDKIISFTVKGFKEPFIYYNCICPSTGREYFLQTDKKTCIEAKASSFGVEGIEWIAEY